MGFSLQKQTAAFQQFLLADPLKACALCLVTLMPLFLLLGRVLADGAMIAVGLLFLAIQVQQGRGFPATLRALPRWFVYALGVWVFWLAVSALAVEPASSFKVAGAWIRFPLFALAVSSWVLTAEADRRRLLWVAAAAAVFLIGYGWIEFYMGYNPLRPHREFHSRLTGPFSNPLVGAYLAKVAFPVIGLLLTLPLIRQKKWGLAVPLLGILAGISTIIMAGDRIPLAL